MKIRDKTTLLYGVINNECSIAESNMVIANIYSMDYNQNEKKAQKNTHPLKCFGKIRLN